MRGTAKAGCSYLHRKGLKTWLPSCRDAEEPEQLLQPQGISSPSVRSGLREPRALQDILTLLKQIFFPLYPWPSFKNRDKFNRALALAVISLFANQRLGGTGRERKHPLPTDSQTLFPHPRQKKRE